MALEKTITTAQGFEAVNAYHRVEQVEVLNKENMVATVRSYKEKTLPYFSEFKISLTHKLNNKNVFAQTYEYLKTLENFADATDC